MTDGDIIHDRLPWVYQKSYKQICEGMDNNDKCGRVVMSAFIKDIQKKGDSAIVLAKNMGNSLRQAIENGSRDWASMSKQLDRLARQTSCSHYDKELVLNASKSVLNDIRYGRAIGVDSSKLPETTVGGVYEGIIQISL